MAGIIRTGALLLSDGTHAITSDGFSQIRYQTASGISDIPTTAHVNTSTGDTIITAAGDHMVFDGYSLAAAVTIGTFHDAAIFPPAIARRTRSSRGYSTVIQETADGERFNISRRARPSHNVDATPALAGDIANLKTLMDFYRGRRGSLIGFRVEDIIDRSTHQDHYSPVDATDYRHKHLIGAGDGTSTAFQLCKRYRHPLSPWHTGPTFERIRPITRPWQPGRGGQVLIFVEGVLQVEGANYTMDYAGGVVTFTVAPAAGTSIEWAGTFHVPARFGVEIDDAVQAEAVHGLDFRVPTLPMFEQNEFEHWSDHRWSGGVLEVSTAVDMTLDLGRGYWQRITPTVAGITIRLPTAEDLIDGGIVAWLMNGAAATFTLRVATSNGADTTVVTALPPQAYCALLVRSDNTWLAMG